MSKDESKSADAGTDASGYTEQLLVRAVAAGASDVHVEPVGGGGVEVKFRIDGMLERIETLPLDIGRSVVLRLMVMAQLLTYRLDIPQEGRIRTQITMPAGNAPAQKEMDLRLAIMPVAHGMRAVVRLPAELTQPRTLDELGLPLACVEALKRFIRGDSGMLLVTGPAGSGKTTTIYALLEYLAKTSPGISIIALEDPIERIVPGVTQIEVAPHGQMTYDRALKSILRQDPQVLMLGEIRDAATASIAVQAALSGHRLIATLHAGDPAGAITRLLEMGLEPYQVSSSVYGVLSQRLLRKVVAEHRRDADATARYKGRIPIAEFGEITDEARKALIARPDAGILRIIFHDQKGHATLRETAHQLVQAGKTDAAELSRVLGSV